MSNSRQLQKDRKLSLSEAVGWTETHWKRGPGLLAVIVYLLTPTLMVPAALRAAPVDQDPLAIISKSVYVAEATDAPMAKRSAGSAYAPALSPRLLEQQPPLSSLSLRNDSGQTITAWKLGCLHSDGSGNSALSGLSKDSFLQYESGAKSAPGGGGLLAPGAVVDVVVPKTESQAEPYAVTSCRVDAVIFANGSYAGSAQAVDELFTRRERIAADTLATINILRDMISEDPWIGGFDDSVLERLETELSREGNRSAKTLRRALEAIQTRDSASSRIRLNELLSSARANYSVIAKHLRQPVDESSLLRRVEDQSEPNKWGTVEQGCSLPIKGTSASSGTCPFSFEYSWLSFSVFALCRNNCTGDGFQVNGPSVTANGVCPECPTEYGRYNLALTINGWTTKFVTEAFVPVYRSPGCDISSLVESSVTCICECGDPSPILISLRDQHFELTDAENGVLFDLAGDRELEHTAWTTTGSDEGFLALDRNMNGVIDNYMEIFGDHTPQPPSDEPNGFRALAVWDDSLNGGNEDGVIDVNDEIFTALLIWVDANHNGISESEELSSLEDVGIESLELDYRRSRRVDKFGNQFKYMANVRMVDGSVVIGWDVFFVQL